jgi:glycosyltransferase involved in cell wall biosynthesis
MLSVIIPTHDSERALVSTLAVLVPGVTAGVVSEVLIADGGSHDDTAAVAEVAGCKFLRDDGPLGRRLKAAAAAARAQWLMFLRPGTILDPAWTDEAGRFLEDASPDGAAAVFRRRAAAQPGLREAMSLVMAALGARPRPEQGLIITKRLYDALGGHPERAADPETDLLRRIGRRRLVRLASAAGVR